MENFKISGPWPPRPQFLHGFIHYYKFSFIIGYHMHVRSCDGTCECDTIENYNAQH